jgi:hypothetical protein
VEYLLYVADRLGNNALRDLSQTAKNVRTEAKQWSPLDFKGGPEIRFVGKTFV